MKKIWLKIIFLSAVFLIAASSIAYEILTATVLSILLGATVFYFSLSIGIYLAALGIGAWLSSRIERNLTEKLIIINSVAAILGGGLVVFLFGSFGFILNFINSFDSGFLPSAISAGFLVFNVLAFIYIFAIGVLAGFALPLFSRILNESEKLKDALGRVLFFDYFGSLVASVFIPVLFFPFIGLIRTSFFIGLLNSLGVLALILFFKREKAVKIGFWIIITAILAFNIAGFWAGKGIENFLEQRHFGKNELLYYAQSPYQRLDFVKTPQNTVRFYLNGLIQFESGIWDYTYHETFAHPAFSYLADKKKDPSVLILGSGDGLLLREVLKYPEVKKVVLVDIDKAVINAAKDLNFLQDLNRNSFSDPRVLVVVDDAFKYIEKNRSEKFDAIFLGFPGVLDFNTFRLYSKEFYLNLVKVLDDGGIAVVQTNGYLSATHQTVVETIKAAGLYPLGYHPPVVYNPSVPTARFSFGFVIIAKNPISKEDFINKKNSVFTNVLTGANLKEIFDDEFYKSMAVLPAKASSIFSPEIKIEPDKVFRLRFSNNFKQVFLK